MLTFSIQAVYFKEHRIQAVTFLSSLLSQTFFPAVILFPSYCNFQPRPPLLLTSLDFYREFVERFSPLVAFFPLQLDGVRRILFLSRYVRRTTDMEITEKV